MKTIKYILLFASLLVTTTAFAQAATRTAVLTWSQSSSTGVTGYNVYRGTTSGGPYTKITTTPVPFGTNSFTDTVPTKVIYFYVFTAVTPACTSTTPITTTCGESNFSLELVVPVPDRPSSTFSSTTASVP